jgi:isopenicillin-N N-acyltransferase-like protein
MRTLKLPEVPLFEIRGSPRTMGRMLGEQAGDLIRSMLDTYKTFMHEVSGLNWAEAVRESHKYLPYAQAAFPEYVEEIVGIAEGAGVSFQDAWLLNCYEGVAEDQKLMACTTIGVNDDVTADGHVYLAHNEDWISGDSKHVYLVRATPDNGPPFLSVSYGPMLCNLGFNAMGIGVGINSVYPVDVRVGVPQVILSRAVLAAERLSDALRACLHRRRASGYNHLLVDRSGEIFSVESSATRHELLYAHEGWLAHTNHYLSERLQDLEQPYVYASSNVRLRRAERLLRRQAGQIGLDSLQSILRDHVSHPDSICKHEDMSDAPHDRSRTLISMIMDLTEMTMWVAPGPPCCGEYLPHRLEAAAALPVSDAAAPAQEPQPNSDGALRFWSDAARVILGTSDESG